MKKGMLTIVGSGLHPGQMTLEAESAIRSAEVVLLIIPTALAVHHILQLNSNVVNLLEFYDGRTRPETYAAMTSAMLDRVYAGQEVCVVAYGHPGVFVTPTHNALRQLKSEGYSARMLPGVAADACLIADLGVDPAEHGWQAYEATSFLLTQPQVTTTSALVLWQIGLTGEFSLTQFSPGKNGLDAMVNCLAQWYPDKHQVCIYEASISPLQSPRIEWISVASLREAQLKDYSTLFIPPVQRASLIEERLLWLNASKADLALMSSVLAGPLSPQ